MCDFSLQSARSRSAKVGDKLTTRNFGTGTRGFAAPEDPTVAVCLLPGTELAFSRDVALFIAGPFASGNAGHRSDLGNLSPNQQGPTAHPS